MKKLIAVTLITAAAVVVVGPTASASAGIKSLAKQECRADRADDPAEFEARYGTGAGAIKRCAKAERREARIDCRQERASEPVEFQAEYGGTDRAAIKRCIKDELV
jgi:hypothetical protein